MIVYHGTNKDAADQILQNGFRPGECSDYGKAIYFSDLMLWAMDYGKTILTCSIHGNILDLSISDHFNIYKSFSPQHIGKQVIKNKFVGIKDGHIIAIYRRAAVQVIQ